MCQKEQIIVISEFLLHFSSLPLTVLNWSDPFNPSNEMHLDSYFWKIRWAILCLKILGVIVVPMGLLGSLFGAAMAKKVMKFRSMIALSIAFNTVTLLLCFVFFYRCEQLPLAGVAFDYNGFVQQKFSYRV